MLLELPSQEGRQGLALWDWALTAQVKEVLSALAQ